MDSSWTFSWEQAYKSALLTLLLLFASSLWLTYRLKVKPITVQRLPRKPRPEYLSKDIVDKILEAEESCTQPKESCDWLNMILKWIYTELLPLPSLKANMDDFFQDMVLNFRRNAAFGHYITGTKVLDVQLGSKSPSFKRARIIMQPTEELPLTVLALDMDYAGGILGIAKVECIGGWTVYIRSRLCHLSGPLHIIIKDTDFYYAMPRFDSVKLRCQIVINGVQFGWVNWLASRLLLPQMMRSKLCYPAQKAKYLVTPEQLALFRELVEKEAFVP